MAFDTYLLDEALARRRTVLEQERQAALSDVLCLLAELGPRYSIRRAYIFGSLTRPGHFTEHSDVDIAVELMEPEHFFAAISTFAAALGREVDLVELDKCHFAHRIRERGIEWTETP
ncbi:MAG: nucleotidyltransferase family protein [Anaerolineae bacterium]